MEKDKHCFRVNIKMHVYYQIRMYSFDDNNSFVTEYMNRMEGHSNFFIVVFVILIMDRAQNKKSDWE